MPRKRGDCGVFSIGYISVYLGRNRYLSVSHMPCPSSTSRSVLNSQAMELAVDGLFTSVALPRQEHVVIGHQRDHDDPRDRDRDEHLPAQPHDLVIAVARERGAEPDVATGEEGDLGQQPPPAI